MHSGSYSLMSSLFDVKQLEYISHYIDPHACRGSMVTYQPASSQLYELFGMLLIGTLIL